MDCRHSGRNALPAVLDLIKLPCSICTLRADLEAYFSTEWKRMK